MARQKIIAGLDIGTTKICAMIVGIKEDNTYEIKGMGMVPSSGLKKGIVIDIERTVASIEQAVARAEQMAGFSIDQALIGIAGSHISSINSHGVVAVSGEDNEIDSEDIERVIEAAKIVSLPPEREIIHVIPREFIVDGCQGITDPCGMSGIRLEVKTHIVTGSITSVQNIIKSVHRMGLEVEGVVLEPLAASLAVLTEDEMELGVALVDIGGGTIDLAVFREGSIVYTSILPLGGNHITNDIAIGLRTPLTNAERIKKEYGVLNRDLAENMEEIKVVSTNGHRERFVSGEMLLEIIEPRVEEILGLVEAELSQAGFMDLLPAGLVLTGGGSLMVGLTQVFSRRFNLSARRGIPRDVSGLVNYIDEEVYLNEDFMERDQKTAIFSTGTGLISYAQQYMSQNHYYSRRRSSPLGFFKRIHEWLQDIF